MCSKNSNKKNDIIVIQKYSAETYGLLAKGDIVVMICIANNRTLKTIREVLAEQYQLAKQEKERRFILKYYWPLPLQFYNSA